MRITVLICTHQRADLLARTIASLNAARRPVDADLRILVVANACSDGTHEYLQRYSTSQVGGSELPLQWIVEPTPGKSNALNRALATATGDAVAFVDDDHRVDEAYLIEVVRALRTYPNAGLICGRILPDWDGTEPAWVHDTGPYRMYPLPVPRFDPGSEPFIIGLDGPIPGGGNLVARLEVIRRTGAFLTELGPTGHDLGGAEDVEWVRRALRGGTQIQYAPAIVQHHFVDPERLRLWYLLRKGYQRSKSVMRFRRNASGVPLYMWRKLADYAVSSAISIRQTARRFYLVRAASALGEISGMREALRHRRERAKLPWPAERYGLCALATAGIAGFALAFWLAPGMVSQAFVASGGVAIAIAIVVIAKSLRDFSQTGPRLGSDILRRYRGYIAISMGRLGAWAIAIGVFWALPGALGGAAFIEATGKDIPWLLPVCALLSLGAAVAYAACSALVANPGLIIASWQYRMARLYGLWRLLSMRGLRVTAYMLISLATLGVAWAVLLLVNAGSLAEAASLAAAAGAYGSMLGAVLWEPDGRAFTSAPTNRPNILMIGCDTLRADRVGAIRDGGSLTPNIDRLTARGTYFASCYVPCARTAPSLISLLTGVWPHRHGVRDNFVHDEATALEMPSLGEALRALSYRSAVVSDWCGADFGKFSLGFDITNIPADQWNLKYFIRQGPKDLRLFLSLFLHNRLGRILLPEIYFLGGVPQTTQIGRRARREINRVSATGEPFLLNVFYSTTHPPFASEYPWYTRYADPRYEGESKFAMARLTDPFDIIRRQGDSRQEFDLDQILALYDSCVAQFDDEVGRLLRYLDESGLSDNTIIVLYSDHGMEFFEHDTWGQGNSAVGDFSARAPLIIADPRIGGNGRIDQVVRSIDVVPTLLELVGGPYVDCDGVSLVPCMRDARINLGLQAFNETGVWITPMPSLPPGHQTYPGLLELLDIPNPSTGTLAFKREFYDQIIRAKDRMVRDERWKLVFQPLESGMKLSLYDVVADPGCTLNLAVQRPDVVRRLWRELRAWMAADPIVRPLIDNEGDRVPYREMDHAAAD